LRSEPSDTATLPEGTDNSGAVDSAAGEDTEPVTASEPEPAKPSAADKARQARAAETGEPLMAELEKAPPPPREEQALRDQARRRFEEPPPMPLRVSFYLFIASGLVFLVSMVMSLIFKQDFIDAQIELNKNPNVTPEQITNTVNQILWIVTIAALAFTVFLGLFGYKATEGVRRGRTLVTIFAVLLVLFQLLLNGTLFGMLSAFLAVFGLALLWSRSARAYFPPRVLP
jgi:hypothetical protein